LHLGKGRLHLRGKRQRNFTPTSLPLIKMRKSVHRSGSRATGKNHPGAPSTNSKKDRWERVPNAFWKGKGTLPTGSFGVRNTSGNLSSTPFQKPRLHPAHYEKKAARLRAVWSSVEKSYISSGNRPKSQPNLCVKGGTRSIGR